MVESYVYENGKFNKIVSDKQIKKGVIVDLYENGINNYFHIDSLLPYYAKNWINNTTIGDSLTSFSLINNNNIRPYFEYKNDTIGFLGFIGQEWHNITGGIGREYHNVTQEIVKHPAILAIVAIPALAIAAPFVIPAVASAYGSVAGAVGAGISYAGSAAGAAYSSIAEDIAPIVSDVGSAITPIVSTAEKVLSPIEKFGEDVLHDIIPISSKAAGGESTNILSTIEGGAASLVGGVAKTVGEGLAVTLASKLLGHNSPHQLIYDGAVDSGYNQQQAQAYSNQYQNSLSSYASRNNISSNDAMSQTAAYVYAHLRDYISHGYTTAKQAIFETLKKTGGVPPNANTPISSILGSSNSINKYIPLILIGGAGILLMSLMGKSKSNNKMEMANG